jgi:hypothetical protein
MASEFECQPGVETYQYEAIEYLLRHTDLEFILGHLKAGKKAGWGNLKHYMNAVKGLSPKVVTQVAQTISAKGQLGISLSSTHPSAF